MTATFSSGRDDKTLHVEWSLVLKRTLTRETCTLPDMGSRNRLVDDKSRCRDGRSRRRRRASPVTRLTRSLALLDEDDLDPAGRRPALHVDVAILLGPHD